MVVLKATRPVEPLVLFAIIYLIRLAQYSHLRQLTN